MDYPYSKSIDRKKQKVRSGQPRYSKRKIRGKSLNDGYKTLTGTTYSATVNDLLAIVI